jgi:hypothetical protein
MSTSMPAATNAKPLGRGNPRRWRPPGLAFSGCVAVACLASLPARASGFLDDPATWTNATPCTEEVLSNCVFSDNRVYDIGGSDSPGIYTITSPTATIDTFISFDYSFDPADPSLALAGYSLDGSTYTLLAASQTSSIGPLLLTSGNSFSFRLTNSGEQPILGVSNFNSSPVPAPVPLLGGAAAFGWIRRRRSQLKARQLVR